MEAIIKRLEKEGFKVSLESNSAGTVYPAHTHSHETKIYILEGDMQLQIDGFWQTATPDKEYVIPKNTEHAIKIGAQGCKYIMATKS
jgi:quercetin dioxygenase-like cupin family protein